MRKASLFLGFLGFWIIICGLATLLLRRLHYANYWGAAVFAPFALVIGLIAVIVAIRIRRERN